MAGYKLNMQNAWLLYIQIIKENKIYSKNMPTHIVPQKIKYLGLNINEEVKEL